MAELGDSDDENKACLVLEEIPISALLAFAEDFTVLKTQPRLMNHLPELQRFSISVLGNGFPALIIETEARTDEEKEDLGLLLLMQQADRQDVVDRDEVMKALEE